MSSVVRALVADDHTPTREGVAAALARHERFDVCACEPDAPGAIRSALRERPDVCVLDVRMPGSGIAAAWEITARMPQVKVVMLTISDADGDLFPALRAGAAGYLLKGICAERLPLALLDVLDGRAAVPRELMARVLEDFRDRGPRRRSVFVEGLGDPLTSREWQVLDLLREDRGTAEIARALTVSKATVRSHVMSVVRKLGVRDRAAAVALFATAADADHHA